MYFTRGVAKRVKLNNDCVDHSNVWVSTNGPGTPFHGSLYHRWLLFMDRRYLQFDIGVHRYMDSKIEEVTAAMDEMSDDFFIDKEVLQAAYPEVWMVDMYFERWVDRKVIAVDRSKLTWVYENLRRDPIGLVNRIKL